MASFINLSLGEPTPRNYITKHLIYSIIWFLDLAIGLLRLDTLILHKLNIDSSFFAVIVPFLLILINIALFVKQKWYYGLAFIFYPVLLIFWFIPKIILARGKIYLLIYYLESIFRYLANFKKSFLNTTILILVLILLSTIDNTPVRIIGIAYFSFLFFKILYRYAIGSLKRGDISVKKNEEKGANSFSKIDLVESIEKQKDDEKLTPEQNLSKKIERMILWNYFLEYVSENVNGYRGKRAFMIVWFFQYFLYFTLTITFFTFLNFELFKIAPSNFSITSVPNLFDFFYYTVKNVTFSNVDSLKPTSEIARIIETSSFFILSIYFLIITISSLLSLKMAEYSKDMERAVKLCRLQNEKIEEHLQTKYNTDISKALTEIETISQSTFKLKVILERIL